MTESSEPGVEPVEVDWKDLSPEALRNVLEDLVSRGEPDEMSITARCDQLLRALRQGKTKLYFDVLEEAVFLRNP